MNLTSCECCGVVLDANVLEFPKDIYGRDGTVDDNLAVWDGDNFVPIVPCPVCEEPIKKSTR